MLADPARRLRDAVEPLAMHATGSAAVRAQLAELGVDRFEGYVWARAASLGEPAPGLVVAAFGVFEPGHLTGAYERARARCPRRVLLDVRATATAASLRAVLGEADVAPVVRALRQALSVASPAGRPLFAGLSGLPWPGDPYGQLWRACELVREHRGDTHLAACVSSGLHPVEMNVLTELWLDVPLGGYTRTRGWSDEDITAAADRLTRQGWLQSRRLTAAGVQLRCTIEQATNRGERALTQALGADLEWLTHALQLWSTRCIETGTFTSDAAKRAAG